MDTLPLLGESGGLPLPHGLVLDSSGLGLLLEVLGSELLRLGLVDVLHQDSLVLESVTLGLEVERVVPAVSTARRRIVTIWAELGTLNSQVLVDLAALSVLLQQSSEDSHSSEPLHLGGHSGLGGTLSLTGTGVSAQSLGGVQLPGSGSRVDGGRLDDAVGGRCVGSRNDRMTCARWIQGIWCRIGRSRKNEVSDGSNGLATGSTHM